MSTKKDINKALNEWLDSKFFDLHTCIPGRIETYLGHTERKARVQPLIKLRDSKNNLIQINPIDNVPVIFPSSGVFNILFPLKKGDGCLLLFSEASIGNYLANAANIVDADDSTRFSLTDCICLPGLWSFKNVPTNASNSIILDEANKLSIQSSLIDLLAATESFLKGDTWKTNWTTFNASVQAAAPTGTSAQNAAAIEAIKAAFAVFAAQLANMLSVKIKGE
jgi:hypothetical protein